jgi:hypothetical protein
MASACIAMISKEIFSRNVESAFSVLITNYDFSVVESNDGYVRLDSPFVSIDVTYDFRNSFEVGIEFYELRDGVRYPTIPFNIGEVLREHSVPNAHNASFFQSSKEDDVLVFIRETAARLVHHCEPCLRGEPKTFAALAQRRSIEASEYTRKMQIESARVRAEEAWRKKNYQGFIAVYQGLADSLPESDKKKLEYAIRQCNVQS